MNRMEVVSRVRVYEVNGEEPKTGTPAYLLTVEAHHIYSDRLVLQDPNGLRITVIASDLRKAIENATNAD
jgi:hypothetical protein